MGNIFYKRLKELRDKNNLSQSDLAKLLGVNLKTVKSWENGKTLPRSIKLHLLGKSFKISSDYLLGLKDINYYDME